MSNIFNLVTAVKNFTIKSIADAFVITLNIFLTAVK